MSLSPQDGADISDRSEVQLWLPGWVTATSLELPENLDYCEWVLIGRQLWRAQEAIQWWVGDWLNFGERRKWGEKYSKTIQEASGYHYQTLRNMAWVAGAVDLSLRNDKLSWSHHKEVAGLASAEQNYWLDRAEAEKFSVRDLRQAIRRAKQDAALKWWAEQERQCKQGAMDSGPVRRSSRVLSQQNGLSFIHANCIDMWEVPNESVDLAIADPPFNLGVDYGEETNDSLSEEKYLEFTENWLTEVFRVLKRGGQLYAFMPIKWMGGWLPMVSHLNWRIIIWCKTMTAHLHRAPTYLHAWEPILWIVNGDRPDILRRSFQFEMDKDWIIGPPAIGEVQGQPFRQGHPTPRPTWLIEYFLVRSSAPGMVVLDPMVGSGTTPWVSKRLGRRCISYDSKLHYLYMAMAWISQNADKHKEVQDYLSSYRQAELMVHWEAVESRRMRGPLVDPLIEMKSAVHKAMTRVKPQEFPLILPPPERDTLRVWLDNYLAYLSELRDSL